MPNFCLPKVSVDKFTEALRSGKIDPEKLKDMSSAERRSLFENIVGKDGAEKVNAEFEAKTLLKNQKYAYTNWAKNVAGLSAPARRDIISRIERMDHILSPSEEGPFLQDLASKRLGIGVTQDEAKTISTLSHDIQDTKAVAKPDGTFPSDKSRIAYGMSQVKLENYVNELKIAGNKAVTTINPAKLAVRGVKGTPGFLTSMLATFDNSFFGRQALKSLANGRDAGIWAKNFAKSWKDIARELGGNNNTLDMIKADIYSRPNSLNGKYESLGKDSGLGALTEEAFPSHAPEKIPLFGRLFKASEAAYNGGALRMRADLADKYIKLAEKGGIDTTDKVQMKGIGTLIGSQTGRGSFGRGVPSNTAGHWFFAPKFLKANFNTLTLHAADASATAFTRKEAAKNLLGIITTTSSVLAAAHALNPKSVELDPRSTHFGKINIFGHWADITGGMGSLLTLSARLVPTHNSAATGHMLGILPTGYSLNSKSGSGNLNNEISGKYGAQTAFDTFASFLSGKAAPVPSTVFQVWKGQDYSGQQPTVKTIAGNTLIPISIQNYGQLNDKGNADRVASMIMDGLGFSVSSNPTTNHNPNVPNASPAVVKTLSNAGYAVPKLGTQQAGKTLQGAQYDKFVNNTNKIFLDSVNKAMNSSEFKNYAPADQKKSLGKSLDAAKKQALSDMGIKAPKRVKSSIKGF